MVWHALTFGVGRYVPEQAALGRAGMSATISRDDLDKMLSASAVKKSESPVEHALAVANLDTLFAVAVPGWRKTDRDANPNIKAVHRLFAPMLAGDQARLVKMTVKEYAQTSQENKIYSVEAVEVDKVSPVPEMVDADRTNGSRLLTGPTGLVKILAQAVFNFNQNTGTKGDLPESDIPEVNPHQGQPFAKANSHQPIRCEPAHRAHARARHGAFCGDASNGGFGGFANVVHLFPFQDLATTCASNFSGVIRRDGLAPRASAHHSKQYSARRRPLTHGRAKPSTPSQS